MKVRRPMAGYLVAFGVGFAACMAWDAFDLLRHRPPWTERVTTGRHAPGIDGIGGRTILAGVG